MAINIALCLGYYAFVLNQMSIVTFKDITAFVNVYLFVVTYMSQGKL